jgi:superoxide dismutase, Cu-Zn family
MKKYKTAIIIGLLSGVAYADYDNPVKAKIFNQAGQFVGIAQFSQYRDGVLVEVKAAGLAPGFHGFHTHATGKCVVDTVTVPTIPPFTSAGPHFKKAADSNHRDHSGDLPVLLVNQNGSAKMEFKTDRFKIQDLFDDDGSAVVIHANPDNYANIPTARYTPAPDATTLATGDAGARLACGVINKY